MTIRTTFQLLLVDCSAIEGQQLQQIQGPVVDRRSPIGEDLSYESDDDSCISAYSDDSSMYDDESSSYSSYDEEDDCRAPTQDDPSVAALFSAFEDLYAHSVVERTPSEAAFLASLEERMARNAERDQDREEEDDVDSVTQARRRGIRSMRVANDVVPFEEDDAEIYMAPLAGAEEPSESNAVPQTRTIPKPRRNTRALPRRRQQNARLQF